MKEWIAWLFNQVPQGTLGRTLCIVGTALFFAIVLAVGLERAAGPTDEQDQA